jgi:hypothetical protein
MDALTVVSLIVNGVLATGLVLQYLKQKQLDITDKQVQIFKSMFNVDDIKKITDLKIEGVMIEANKNLSSLKEEAEKAKQFNELLRDTIVKTQNEYNKEIYNGLSTKTKYTVIATLINSFLISKKLSYTELKEKMITARSAWGEHLEEEHFHEMENDIGLLLAELTDNMD